MIPYWFRIVLDPVFPSPDLFHNRKCAINEIPQEIKFTLVFDEEIDKHLIAKSISSLDKPIAEEMIESDEESELNDGSEEQQDIAPRVALPWFI